MILEVWLWKIQMHFHWLLFVRVTFGEAVLASGGIQTLNDWTTRYKSIMQHQKYRKAKQRPE